MKSLLRRLAALSLLVLASRADAAFGPASFLSPGAYQNQETADVFEAADGTLHAVFGARHTTATGTYLGVSISYVQSTDGGASWSAPVQVAWDSGWYVALRSPKLVVDAAGRVHVTYHYLNYFGWGEVRALRSLDGGKTWSGRSLNGGCFPWNATPDLGPSGEVYAVWDRWKCNHSYIPTMDMFGASFDGGATWSVREAIPGGTVPNSISEARSLTVDDAGVLHIIGGYGNLYARSFDRGASFVQGAVPAGFKLTGLSDLGGELLSAGGYAGKVAFIRSTDGGSSWEWPVQIANVDQSFSAGQGWANFSQLLSDGVGGYYAAISDSAWGGPQGLYASQDFGASWSAPEYVGSGRVMKLLFVKDGSFVALGTFPDPAGSGSQWVALKRYVLPAGVDAPDYLSLWEKSEAVYGFRVFGKGTVTASFPAEDVGVAATAAVTVGGAAVAAGVVESGGRVLVTFPVDATEWTDCRIPISVLKGTVGKWGAISARLNELDAALVAAAEAGDGDAAARAREDGLVLQAALGSIEREFVVTLAPATGAPIEDRTSVLVYDKLQSLYAHFKASPPEAPGAELVLMGDALTVGAGEPFRFDVKVTHLTKGQTAQIALRGGFEIVELQETIEAGARTTAFTLFYPPTFTAGSDAVSVDVTVDGVTVSAPVVITVR